MPIDLRSDTVTQPTSPMRRAMAEAEVGDDVLDGDPTVRRLEARVAELLGKEGALFFPSGTMANQTAVWLLSRPGTEILLDAGAHIIHYEGAGAAALAGVQVRSVTPRAGMMDAEDLRGAMRAASPHVPAASLVCVENTHNGAGGRVTSLAALQSIRAVANEFTLPVHMDGARLWNASVATGTSLQDFAGCADTVMVSFSKGLGAPVGAALSGAANMMSEGWRVRKRFGGGMRQSGILAAGALYGLEHHFERLHEDHHRAREFASLIDGVGGARVVPPDTNIIMVDLPERLNAFSLVQRLAQAGVLITPWSATRIRAVTHLGVGKGDVEHAAVTLARTLETM
ncbi:MAG: aminotransferase class I/II-fold pyridoxal phosphate-dependent enzyme [Anaerolineae bacterium]|nr:aminotransferase class I/II-fold pyridoxal phosphate-dependent enzyme [Gemmatimonadaceae bacterium]